VDKKPEEAPSADKPRLGTSIVQLIPPILNSVALLAALGLLAYTKILYKKPPITEESERERLNALHAKTNQPTIPALMNFEPITVNIKSVPDSSSNHDPSHYVDGKLHYVTLAFTLEIRNQKDFITSVTPQILDKLILLLGKKYFNELTTVQGRYILHSQFLEQVNKLVTPLVSPPTKEDLITQLYFTHFLVQ
jgi:flagellar basal body-associated protein FliL